MWKPCAVDEIKFRLAFSGGWSNPLPRGVGDGAGGRIGLSLELSLYRPFGVRADVNMLASLARTSTNPCPVVDSIAICITRVHMSPPKYSYGTVIRRPLCLSFRTRT